MASQKQEKLISQLGTPKTSRSRDVPFEEKNKMDGIYKWFQLCRFLDETRIHLWIHDCFNHIKFMTVLLGHVVVWNFANASEGHRSWPGERPREPWSMRPSCPTRSMLSDATLTLLASDIHDLSWTVLWLPCK